MRKLFEMGSLLSLEEWSTLKILGGYELVKISESYAMIRKEGYTIEITASEIQFDMLLEHSALLSFTGLHDFEIHKDFQEGETHET